jgi:hypothetical protein
MNNATVPDPAHRPAFAPSQTRSAAVSLHDGPVPEPPGLLQQVRDALARQNYSMRTEQAYIDWIKRFVLFHRKRHPPELGQEQR